MSSSEQQIAKLEFFEDVAHTWRKSSDVGDEVVGNIGSIPKQFLEGEGAGVVERLFAVTAVGNF